MLLFDVEKRLLVELVHFLPRDAPYAKHMWFCDCMSSVCVRLDTG